MCGNARERRNPGRSVVDRSQRCERGGYKYDASRVPFHVVPCPSPDTRPDATARRTADDWKLVRTDRASPTYNLVRSRSMPQVSERFTHAQPLCAPSATPRMD